MLQFARREPSAILFAMQLLGVLLYPFMEGSEVGRALFSVFGIAILGLAVLAVRSMKGLTRASLLLAAPATVLLLIQAATRSNDLQAYSSGFEAVLYFYAAAGLIAYMLADHIITRDEMWAVGATFTLLAWAFAYVFVVVQAVEPGSFTGGEREGPERTWMELLYMSFANLTSVGLSDVTAIKPFARGVVMIEQVVGLGYIAVLVSRIIGLTIRRPAEEPAPPS